MLRTYQRSNKYQLYILWLDPIGVRTHDLPLTYVKTNTCSLISTKKNGTCNDPWTGLNLDDQEHVVIMIITDITPIKYYVINKR